MFDDYDREPEPTHWWTVPAMAALLLIGCLALAALYGVIGWLTQAAMGAG